MKRLAALNLGTASLFAFMKEIKIIGGRDTLRRSD